MQVKYVRKYVKQVQDIFIPNMEKHKPYASIDYEDLEYGIFFENSEDEDDKWP